VSRQSKLTMHFQKQEGSMGGKTLIRLIFGVLIALLRGLIFMRAWIAKTSSLASWKTTRSRGRHYVCVNRAAFLSPGTIFGRLTP